MKLSSVFILAMTLLVVSGCSSRTSIATIRISDPDAGGTMDVPVQRNGTFSKEAKIGDYAIVTSGAVSDEAAGVSSVKLVYDRRLKLATGGTKMEKIETTFKAQLDVDVPIGKNPSDPDAAGNAMANVTAKLLKGM